MISRDGHVRVLPLHVANKIAAGEVVERPASVVKELVENSIDAGANSIKITVTQGGRKLVSVQDDGCGMTRDDAVLSLERQATSKIRDVDDIEQIDTLGFRGEAIPSIASVSRFSITTRRHDSDEGTFLQVNAGALAEVRAAGCPPGTLIEVRDLFCNVPARRKFLRAYVTEENHVKQVFTVHALAHPSVAFSLTVDGRELYRLAPASDVKDRVFDLFGDDFAAELLRVDGDGGADGMIDVSGFIERPNLHEPTRRDQYVFVNGRPATAPAIAYAIREAYPRRQGDVRPALILFINLPPSQVDVNVHPTKREVRFRDNNAVKRAVIAAITAALTERTQIETANVQEKTIPPAVVPPPVIPSPAAPSPVTPPPVVAPPSIPTPTVVSSPLPTAPFITKPAAEVPRDRAVVPSQAAPMQVEFAVDPNSTSTRPWKWFKYLAQTDAGYLLLETDAGMVTLNPTAARERIAYERLLDDGVHATQSQPLLIPETVHLSPADFARVKAAAEAIKATGFSLEEFGRDTFKIDAVPHIADGISPASILTTIAADLADGGMRRGTARWREELVAKSVARACAGSSARFTEESATRLVEDLCAARMPYVCPRGKPTMIFTSNRELDRKFAR